MANSSLFSLGLFVTLFALTITTAVSDEDRKPYIVHMSRSMKPLDFSLHEHWYASLVNEATSSSNSEDEGLLLYTYDVVLSGFAAKLSSAEAAALESKEGCMAVIPSSVRQMHTTHSPQFLGLEGSHYSPWPQSNYGKDVIVGVIDTGIWPESKSFNDRGLGPVPARWKGVCQVGEKFNVSHCNRKIIGARYFFKGYEAQFGKLNKTEIKSARDNDGHGTQCASTVAGSAVGGASFNGFANGTAIGMAPHARLAIYKILWNGGIDDTDILAAIEMAVADGVDIVSMSIGGRDRPFYNDSMAIGAFKAMAKGVFISAAAGNDGPIPFIIENTAPWIMTVGASSIDRKFPATLRLGNRQIYRGSSLSPATEANQPLPLVYVSKHGDPSTANGKIQLVDIGYNNPFVDNIRATLNKIDRVGNETGPAAFIFATKMPWGAQELIRDYRLPSIAVSFAVGEKIRAYINSTSKPTATINPSGLTVKGKAVTAPLVASLSGRGPSLQFLDIMKPDVVAPGVDILAAVKNGYEFMSGTSMACPHVSGLAALIRATHPSWSPAAIKSSLMTSAYVRDNKNQPIKDFSTLKVADPLSLGAGHVNPAAAIDPGLIYDLAPLDYIHFLCTLKYTKKQIDLLMENNSIVCPRSRNVEERGDLNYPSFSIPFNSTKIPQVVVRSRRVTNVGAARSTYKVHVEEPFGVKVSVQPDTLVFTKKNQKLKFIVKFENTAVSKDNDQWSGEGEISWKCIQGGTHIVRSPIVVLWLDT